MIRAARMAAVVALLAWLALGLTLVATAGAHKPRRSAAINEAVAVAEDRTTACAGSLGQGRNIPKPRFVGGGRHYRIVEVVTLDGFLDSYAWDVKVGHDAQGYAQVKWSRLVGSTNGARC